MDLFVLRPEELGAEKHIPNTLAREVIRPSGFG